MNEMIIFLLGMGLATAQLGVDQFTRLIGLILMVPGLWFLFVDRGKKQ